MKTLLKRLLFVGTTLLLTFGLLVGCALEEETATDASTSLELDEKGWTYPGDVISEDFIFTGITGRFEDWADYYPYGLTFAKKSQQMSISYNFLAEEGTTFRLTSPNANAGYAVTVKEIDSGNNRVKLTVKEIEL